MPGYSMRSNILLLLSAVVGFVGGMVFFNDGSCYNKRSSSESRAVDQKMESVTLVNESNNSAKTDAIDSVGIKSKNPKIRLLHLIDIWHDDEISLYKDDILYLIKHDPDSKVTEFASWLANYHYTSGGDNKNVSSNIDVSSISEDPEAQLRSSLSVDVFAIAQATDDVSNNSNFLAEVSIMSAEQRKVYIQNLVNTNDDAAVVALNDLVVSQDEETRQAALDGLLTLMEYKTGHYALVVEMLEANSVFLNEDQLKKFEKNSE